MRRLPCREAMKYPHQHITYKVPAEAAAAQTQAQFYACVSSSIRCAGGKGAK